MQRSTRLLAHLGQGTTLVRIGCMLLIAAAGLRATFAALFETVTPVPLEHWPIVWAGAFATFVAAYAITSIDRIPQSWRLALLALESALAIFLIWLYPNFIVTVLLVVVAWQIAWATSLRVALWSVVAQSGVLTAIKCAGQADSMSFLVLVTTLGFELFAVSAAHLARSEIVAKENLARAHAELRATHAFLTESARMAERLRISRDLHDALGHNLTSLTIHLDVASRLESGAAADQLRCARDLAGRLLDDVRDAVRQVRVDPVNLRQTLLALGREALGLDVRIDIPNDMGAIDAARAEAVYRCVQELITNAIRHADATELRVELRQSCDGGLAIIARDDGRGGEIAEGRGLAGMRERFELLGGNIAISSKPGEGFCVHGEIPPVGAQA